jgi:amino acid adenylation domain-containing protein
MTPVPDVTAPPIAIETGASPFAFTRAGIDSTIPERFAAIVGELPEALALSSDGRHWTYRALNEAANAVAHAIGDRVVPGVGCVASVLPLSPEMVIATLAILKAGKAVLAVHPAMPPAARAATLEDAQPDLILTTRAAFDEVRETADRHLPVVCLEDADPARADDPPVTAGPDDPCAIYYTSGSTGRPKGVARTHRAALHRVWLTAIYDRFVPGERQSLLAHGAFLPSEADMFGPLLQGAVVCPFNVATHDLPDFRAWLTSECVTHLHPPVQFFRTFLASLDGGAQFPDLRQVALAGDVVRPDDVKRVWRHVGPSCVVMHRFSMTETAILTLARFNRDTPLGDVLEAGPPVPDKHIDLVDETGAAVPPGETGEIVVRSRYLAAGYWRRPAETAAAFRDVEDGPGERLYRTGDLGRFLPDGSLVYLGRQDYRVKVRGYRVDTREVEAALASLDGVQTAAVVTVRDDASPSLHAFVVAADRDAIDSKRLRAALRQVVPPWQVPARVHVIEDLPRGLTGKVDRQRLIEEARLRAAAPVTPAAFQAPADPIEQRVMVSYERVLGVGGIARDADFFDLGGNSLQFTELHLGLEAEFGELPLEDLLRDTTVSGVAALIARLRDRVGDARSTSLLVPLRRADAGRPIFLVHGAAGRALARPHLLDALAEGGPVYAFRARGLEEDEEPHTRLAAMAQEYVTLMRQVQSDGPYCLGGLCVGTLLALEMARVLRADGQTLGPMLLIDPPLPPAARSVGQRVARAAVLSVTALLQRLRLARPLAASFDRRGAKPAKVRTRAWLSLRLAAYRHRITPYDGPVHVVGSHDRLAHVREGAWRRYLTGEVQVREVSGSHRDVFDPANPDTAQHLRTFAAAARGS